MQTTTDIDGLEAALAMGAVLIDVRERDEYAAGHVPGAVNVPMGRLPSQLPHLRGLGPLHLICQSGNRSGAMCDVVAAAGYDSVNVRGGTSAWIRAGKPVEAGAR